MKKILYCMHIGWNWIKQRPHFIAEELSNNYRLHIISDHSYRVKSNHNRVINENIRIKEFYKIPFLDHFTKLVCINDFLRKVFYFIQYKKYKPDYVYVMKPEMIRYLPKKLNVPLIYDCMDDMAAFCSEEKRRCKVLKIEGELVDKADLIFVSSESLKQKMVSRYGKKLEPKIVLIRNGYNGNDLKNKKLEFNDYCKYQYTLCYFGTIAEWFNFDFVLKSLDYFPQLNYLLIGPLQAGTSVPKHERINYVGTVPHDQLANKIKDADGFIMPFFLTDLIQSVDPVKLYEYINFNKNILCVNYPEVDRFSDFVYFYNTYDEYISQIKKMMSGNLKYTLRQREAFLKKNTWTTRANVMMKSISNLK